MIRGAMFDHIFSVVNAFCEIAIVWIMVQERRKAKNRPEMELKMPPKRWILMFILSLGPIAAIALNYYLRNTHQPSKAVSTSISYVSGTAAVASSGPAIPEDLKTWTDPATGKMWTNRDNGYNIDRPHAAAYCENLNSRDFAGYKGWGLPEMIDLRKLNENGREVSITPPGTAVTRLSHVNPNIEVTGFGLWAKSSSRAGWGGFWYVAEDQESVQTRPLSHDQDTRALCVRGGHF